MVRILVASLRERSLDAPRDWARDIKDDFKFQSAALDQKKAKRLISFNIVVEVSRVHPLAKILSIAPQRKGNILFPLFSFGEACPCCLSLSLSLSLKGMDAGSIFSIFPLSLMERK